MAGLYDPSDPDVAFAFGLLAAAALATVVGAALLLLLTRRYDVSVANRFISVGLAFAAGLLLYVAFAEVLPDANAAYCCITPDHYAAATFGTLFGGVLLSAGFDCVVHWVRARGTGGGGAGSDVEGGVVSDPAGKPGRDLRSPTNEPPATEASPLVPAEEGGAPKERRAGIVNTGIALACALALHNIPEGIVLFLGAVASVETGVTLVIAIAIHNLPLGASIALPIVAGGESGWKALGWATMAGMAQFLAGLIGYAVVTSGGGISPDVYAVFFGLTCGILVFVAVHELIPVALRTDASGGTEFSFGLLAGLFVMALTLVLLDELGGHSH